jgi:hypothetical protein
MRKVNDSAMTLALLQSNRRLSGDCRCRIPQIIRKLKHSFSHQLVHRHLALRDVAGELDRGLCDGLLARRSGPTASSVFGVAYVLNGLGKNLCRM